MSRILAIRSAVGIVLAFGNAYVFDHAYAACDIGEKIDKSMAGDARVKITSAGYQKISNQRKGCDNYWHAAAEKDGKPVYVVLSPQGEVIEEGN